MRKIFFIGLIAVLLGSCSLDNPSEEANDYRAEFVPIATVEMPETFELGETYVIPYTYYRPTTCHLFGEIFYEGNQNQHIIYLTNTVLTGGASCETLTNEIINRTFDFTVSSNDTYYFKFWQGLDENGQDMYLEFEVPVN